MNWRLITFSWVDVILLVVIVGERERGTWYQSQSRKILIFFCIALWMFHNLVRWICRLKSDLVTTDNAPFISHQTYIVIRVKTRNIEFLIISVWFISQNVTVLTNYNNILKRRSLCKDGDPWRSTALATRSLADSTWHRNYTNLKQSGLNNLSFFSPIILYLNRVVPSTLETILIWMYINRMVCFKILNNRDVQNNMLPYYSITTLSEVLSNVVTIKSWS